MTITETHESKWTDAISVNWKRASLLVATAAAFSLPFIYKSSERTASVKAQVNALESARSHGLTMIGEFLGMQASIPPGKAFAIRDIERDDTATAFTIAIPIPDSSIDPRNALRPKEKLIRFRSDDPNLDPAKLSLSQLAADLSKMDFQSAGRSAGG